MTITPLKRPLLQRHEAMAILSLIQGDKNSTEKEILDAVREVDEAEARAS